MLYHTLGSARACRLAPGLAHHRQVQRLVREGAEVVRRPLSGLQPAIARDEVGEDDDLEAVAVELHPPDQEALPADGGLFLIAAHMDGRMAICMP